MQNLQPWVISAHLILLMHVAYNEMRKQRGCCRSWHLIGLITGSLTLPVSVVAHSSVAVDGRLPLCMQTAHADSACCAVHRATHARFGPCPPWWPQGTFTHQKCPLCHDPNAWLQYWHSYKWPLATSAAASAWESAHQTARALTPLWRCLMQPSRLATFSPQFHSPSLALQVCGDHHGQLPAQLPARLQPAQLRARLPYQPLLRPSWPSSQPGRLRLQHIGHTRNRGRRHIPPDPVCKPLVQSCTVGVEAPPSHALIQRP